MNLMKDGLSTARAVERWVDAWELGDADDGTADPIEAMYELINHFFNIHPGGFSQATFDILEFIDNLHHDGRRLMFKSGTQRSVSKERT